MENKMEELTMRGLFLLHECEQPFLKEWGALKASLKLKLIDDFDEMIVNGFKSISKTHVGTSNNFILLLIQKWQKNHPQFTADSDALFLISMIENLFHKVLKLRVETTFLDHQAIQIFFTKIIDKALRTEQREYQDDKWLRLLLGMRAAPSNWLAILSHDQVKFSVKKVVCAKEHGTNAQLISICEGLQAEKINDLSLALARLLSPGDCGAKVIEIPFPNETLLVCVKDQSVTGVQIETIRNMFLKQVKVRHLESELEWKDATLLFQQRLIHARGASDAVKLITQGLVDYLPFSRCALFIYSPGENRGVGVHAHNVTTGSVHKIKENISDLPLFTKHLKHFSHSKPIFIEEASSVLPLNYVHEYSLKSLVVLPIYVQAENRLIGLALLDRGENSTFSISSQTLTALIKFGHYGGELLNKYLDDAIQLFGAQRAILTKREREVLKLIAEGASIIEAADTLHLSSYTVRDYISAIIQKLNAKNRTDAAIKAHKMKLI